MTVPRWLFVLAGGLVAGALHIHVRTVAALAAAAAFTIALRVRA